MYDNRETTPISTWNMYVHVQDFIVECRVGM